MTLGVTHHTHTLTYHTHTHKHTHTHTLKLHPQVTQGVMAATAAAAVAAGSDLTVPPKAPPLRVAASVPTAQAMHQVLQTQHAHTHTNACAHAHTRTQLPPPPLHEVDRILNVLT